MLSMLHDDSGWFMELDDSRMSRWCLETAKAVAAGSFTGDVMQTIEAKETNGTPKQHFLKLGAFSRC